MRVPVLGCALLLLFAEAAVAEDKPAKAHTTLEAGPARMGLSLYQLDTRLTDQDGKAVKLGDYRGQPVIISMFYGTCPYACPLLMSRIKRLEAALAPEVRAQVRVVLVSLDPEHDTPESLKKLAKAHGLDEARWRLLRTEEEYVPEVAAVLGIKYRPLREGGMNHSSVLTLLDRDGVMELRVEGPEASTDGLVARLTELAAAKR